MEKGRVSVARAAARRIRLQRVRNRIAQRLAYRSVLLCDPVHVAYIDLEPISVPPIQPLGPCRALNASSFERAIQIAQRPLWPRRSLPAAQAMVQEDRFDSISFCP